jgi:hypothetical protein
MKKITKYLFLAATFVACAPLQAMQNAGSKSAIRKSKQKVNSDLKAACYATHNSKKRVQAICEEYGDEIDIKTIEGVLEYFSHNGGNHNHMKTVAYLHKEFKNKISPECLANCLIIACTGNNKYAVQYLCKKCNNISEFTLDDAEAIATGHGYEDILKILKSKNK